MKIYVKFYLLKRTEIKWGSCNNWQNFCGFRFNNGIRELVKVSNSQQLLLRTTLDRRGKSIIFIADEKYTGFNKEISICFPPFSVLGEEMVCLEIIPEEVIENYNEHFRKKSKVITPVLHVDRQNGAPFLKMVTVVLPLVCGAEKWLPTDCPISCTRTRYSRNDSTITIQTNKFSPVAASYCEIKKILRAVGLADEYKLTYEEFGIYLMVEQSIGPDANDTLMKFDVRKFRNWEEHQRYRMDTTKTFCLLVNPQIVRETDWYQEIRVTIEGLIHRLKVLLTSCNFLLSVNLVSLKSCPKQKKTKKNTLKQVEIDHSRHW